MIIEIMAAVCEECFSDEALVFAYNGIVDGNPVCPMCELVKYLEELARTNG
jgi:hypothetical protein